MKVTVDQNKCVSSGQCVLNAGDVFDQRDDDGVVVLLDDSPADDQAVNVRNAAAVCPALAIDIEEGAAGLCPTHSPPQATSPPRCPSIRWNVTLAVRSHRHRR